MCPLALLLLLAALPSTTAVCQFQNPFYFKDRPTVKTVVDSNGEMVADRVRVTWGRLQNFKCVDYFQIEYWEQNDKAGTFQVTEKINRHRSSFDVTIKPCRDLLFRVIASEDWQGTRQDYRVGSENVNFRVDYAPKFIRYPVVREKKGRNWGQPRGKREAQTDQEEWKYIPFKKRMKTTTTTEATSTTTEHPFNLVLTDIDWPTCMSYIVFDYYDTVYNESVYNKTYDGPFTPRMEFTIVNKLVDCDEEYSHITRLFGLTGTHSMGTWTPPACLPTTPAPTTTTPIPPTTFWEEGELERAERENWELKESIDGLKQQYGPIGKKVYESVKESAFHTFESYLARRQVLEGGDKGDVEELAKNFKDPDFALDNLI